MLKELEKLLETVPDETESLPQTSTCPRLCIYCKHFYVITSHYEPGYSSWTPSFRIEAEVGCGMGHWTYEGERDNTKTYRKKIETAKLCDDFAAYEDYD